jgi:hypothetical protein
LNILVSIPGIFFFKYKLFNKQQDKVKIIKYTEKMKRGLIIDNTLNSSRELRPTFAFSQLFYEYCGFGLLIWQKLFLGNFLTFL